MGCGTVNSSGDSQVIFSQKVKEIDRLRVLDGELNKTEPTQSKYLHDHLYTISEQDYSERH